MSLKIQKEVHAEGHTSVSYDDDGKYIATCGIDGRLRVWEAPEYDVMTTYPIGESAFAVHVRGNRVYVSNDNNAIPALDFPFIEPEGFLSFFTAPVTHITSNKSGSVVCAGSCDFTVRVLNVKDMTFKDLKHDGPVLSVALDPKEEFLASSSCDGSVCVWNIATNACVQSWKGSLPKSNSFENSKILCRIAWEPVNGSYLAIPTKKAVSLYQRNSWGLLHSLEEPRIDAELSVCAFSRNGLHLAAGSVTGVIAVWSVTSRKCTEFIPNNNKKSAITGLAWNPKQNEELTYCDKSGQLYVMTIPAASDEQTHLTEDDALAMLDEPLDADDSDNENSFSISQIKAETVGLSDDETNDATKPVTPKVELIKKNGHPNIIDTSEGISDTESIVSRRENSSWGVKPCFQASFQPGSTPVHLSHRFMIWNSVGIVTNYNTDDENTIDIEFHDSSVHHAMHINNTSNYVVAAISREAVALANESDDDIASSLMLMHFGTWDSSKEWSITMPSKEDIQAIAIGDGWVAVATNNWQLRIFTIGGMQLEPISLPGPVVCMSGHEDKLIVAYHSGAGLPGNQSIEMIGLIVIARKTLFTNVRLPLSPQTSLMWLGFTDEGTPVSVDTNGIVRLLRHAVGNVWIEICNTRAQAKGKSDHFFVVGLSEIQQNIRCIPCKGARYPPTLPRPVMTVLPLQLPLCELNTEKSKLEESIWRHKIISEDLIYLENNNYEIETATKDETFKTLQAALMKAFALACRSDRDFRAEEICEFMSSSHAVQLAIKYATTQKHFQLAQRLSQTAFQKLEEETRGVNEYQDGSVNEVIETPSRDKIRRINEVKRLPNDNNSEGDVLSDEEESEDELKPTKSTPDRANIGAENISTSTKRNPFKKESAISKTPTDRGKGAEVFETLNKKQNEKKDTPFTFAKKKSGDKTRQSAASLTFNKRFNDWFQTYKEELQDEHPELDQAELKKVAREKFKKIEEKKQKPNEKTVSSQGKKRKTEELLSEEPALTKQPNAKKNCSSVQGKLANFVFVRKD